MKQSIIINGTNKEVFDMIMKSAMSEMRIKGKTGVSYQTIKGMTYKQKVTGQDKSRYEVNCIVTEFVQNERYYYELRDEIRHLVHHVRYTFYPRGDKTKLVYEEYSEKHGKQPLSAKLLTNVFYRKSYKNKLMRIKDHVEIELDKEMNTK